MFYFLQLYSKLTQLDISKCNNNNVIKINCIFYECSSSTLLLYFLVTNYLLLDDLENKNIIEITRYDDNISNDVKLNNITYKYPGMDAIFIEINPKDDKINENDFL